MRKHLVSGIVIVTLAIVFSMAKTNPATADTVTVQPSGEYAQIDTHLANEAIRMLSKGTSAESQETIAQIKAAPDKYAPPVFYVLSNTLFQHGEKDDAAFWFYAGQLRARFDANRCAEISAREAVAEMNDEFGAPINAYAFQNIEKLEKLIPQVIKWDKNTAHNYDQRWINLGSLEAMNSGLEGAMSASKSMPLSLPKDQWDKIAEKTRKDYLSGFREAIKKMNK